MTHEEAMRKQEILCKNLKYYSKEIGGIGELEKRIGVSAGYFSRVGGHKRGISLAHIIMALGVLGKSFDELCDEDAAKKAEMKAIDDEIERLVAKRRELEG